MKLTKTLLEELIREALEIHVAPENLADIDPEEAYGMGYKAKGEISEKQEIFLEEENSDWRIELVDQEIENRKIQLTDEQKTALYAWAKKQSPSVRRINIFRQKLVSQLKNLPLNEEALDEVFSEKQRRWACAQMNKPSAKISKADATEMCKSKEIKS